MGTNQFGQRQGITGGQVLAHREVFFDGRSQDSLLGQIGQPVEASAIA
jgi:hypothetical protein